MSSDESATGPGDEQPETFADWLASYPKSQGDLDDSGWAEHDLEAAFDAGEQAGWERATEYYRTGGSFK